MKKVLPILILFFFPAALGLGTWAYFAKFPWEFWDRMLPVSYGEMTDVVVKAGLNARQSAQAFYDQGALTDSPAALARWMTRFGIDRKFRPGRYRVGK